MAKKKTAAKPKKPSAAVLKKYWSTRKQRLELNRQAEDLKEVEDGIKQQVKDWLLSLTKSDRIQTLGKFTLSIKSKVSVAWKQHYINEKGPEAAEALRQRTTPTEYADISKAD